MELYITLCYAIKHSDIGLLYHAMRKVYLILQALSIFKPKYAHEMIKQVHIFNTKAADPIFQEIYLANFLVNLRRLLNLFYKMDLLLKYQNNKFKQFCIDCSSLLQKSDKIFQLYALSVDILKKIRTLINQIIISQE